MYIVDETDTRFCIRTSSLPNAGLGCFALEKIPKGDYLEVIGVLVRCNSPADHCTHYANRYKFAPREKYTAYIVPMGYGGMVNHTDDAALQNVELRWVKNMPKRSQHAGEIVYMAIRDIEPDEELLGNYGEAVGKEVRWYQDNSQIFAQGQDVWQSFLELDLYNLGILRERL